MYTVNGTPYTSFFAAIAAAKAAGANVIEAATGNVRWHPAPPPKAAKVRHVLVNADGSRTPLGKVRQR